MCWRGLVIDEMEFETWFCDEQKQRIEESREWRRSLKKVTRDPLIGRCGKENKVFEVFEIRNVNYDQWVGFVCDPNLT